jgi:hypothetical protein
VCEGTLVIRLPRRPTVWVFTDDPAMQRSNTVSRIEQVGGYECLLLDASDREDLASLPTFPMPDAVVFGDMHVLLEDPVLHRCCEGGAGRILLSTHQNADLLDAAKAFCGFDHHLLLPIETALVRVVLEDATSNRSLSKAAS